MTARKLEKIDLVKIHKTEYIAPKKPVIIQVAPAKYLTIDGAGKPGGPEFQSAIGALYGAAFTVKMTRKFAGQQDYSVCKLECQWWADGTADLSRVPQDQWRWKFMIRTPDFVTPEELRGAVSVLLKRGKGEEVKRVCLESIKEGPCVQMLHVGPYDKEGETIALMKAFAEKQCYAFHGRHHEIYISDPRRVPAERLKTILREPVLKA